MQVVTAAWTSIYGPTVTARTDNSIHPQLKQPH